MIFRCEEPAIDFPVFTTRPDTLFGATFFVLAPEHPDLERLVAGTEHEQEVRDYVQQALDRVGRGARRHRAREDRRVHRPPRRQPGQRRAHPGLGLRLRADGVRHRRDHGRARARPARLRVRAEVRPRDPARWSSRWTARLPADEAVRRRTRATSGWSTPGRFDGHDRRRRRSRRSPLARGARARAARPSTTGCATGSCRASATGARRSRSSTATRDGIVPVPGGPAAGAAAGHRGLRAEGQVAARRERGVRQHDLPAVRRPGAPRDRHDGHVRRLVLVLPALLRPAQRPARRGTARSSTTGCRSTSTSAASSTRSCT